MSKRSDYDYFTHGEQSKGMTDLRRKSVLIADHGLYLSLALRMAREFGQVGYHHLAWKRGFPGYEEYDIGRGFDEIKVEHELFDAVDRYDLIWFPDVLNGDLQSFLRKKGYRVFGSGKGDELELYRIYAKRLMETVGLPVQPYKVVTGIEALIDFLKNNKGWFVKLSKLRGITETFGSDDYWLIEPRLDELAYKTGIRKKYQEFLLEQKIDTELEYGYDGVCVDGKFPDLAANGVEVKDVAYACIVQEYAKLPKGMLKVNGALAAPLAAYNYRNFFSTEIREAKDGTPYLIDLTCRHPSPAGETQQELWGNLGEVAFEGAEGNLVQFKAKARYAVQSMIFADRADENVQPIKFPDEFRDNVKLYFECREDDHSYVLPQITKMNEIGSVVTIGDDLEETVERNKEIAETIEGDKVCVHTDKIEDVLREFEAMEKRGINVTPAKI